MEIIQLLIFKITIIAFCVGVYFVLNEAWIYAVACDAIGLMGFCQLVKRS